MRIILRWIIVLAVPIVLTMGLVRVTTLPWYLRWEYSLPGFPEDEFGMSAPERMRLARVCIRFLNRPTSLEILGALKFDSGDPAFNARELGHMADVKRVYDQLTAVAGLALALSGAAGWILVRRRQGSTLWAALSDGGLLTLATLIALGLWMALGFEAFFTAFHTIFFEGDSWLFSYSDTLIRLFPLRFWQDAGLLIAAAVSGASLALALLGRALQKRLDRPAPPPA